MKPFELYESEVRSYCRSFPTVFAKAKGHSMWSVDGKQYIDFFAGAGALNYGHNEPFLKTRLLEYLSGDYVVHSLDMATQAKGECLEAIQRILLGPRHLDYKVMFPGPTGTNAVESALKLARKATKRSQVIAFTNAFHGMTLGSLAVTGNRQKRAGAGVTLPNTIRMPFAGYHGDAVDTVALVERHLNDPSSGIAPPAAILLETVQGEGGVNTASKEWLTRIAELARHIGALLIVDDIQVGCGRTGSFFSFEPAGLAPDIVCLSKSLSGYGLPLAVVLVAPRFDVFEPGEHNGTFRGHNPAFVTAKAALERFWSDHELAAATARKARFMRSRLLEIAERCGGKVRGRGLIQGIAFPDDEAAGHVANRAFERGLLIEPAGARGEVVKLLPPLTISDAALGDGLDILERCARDVGAERATRRNGRRPQEALA